MEVQEGKQLEVPSTAADPEELVDEHEGGLGALFEESEQVDVVPEFGGCEDNGMGTVDDGQIDSSSRQKMDRCQREVPNQRLTDSDMKLATQKEQSTSSKGAETDSSAPSKKQ